MQEGPVQVEKLFIFATRALIWAAVGSLAALASPSRLVFSAGSVARL